MHPVERVLLANSTTTESVLDAAIAVARYLSDLPPKSSSYIPLLQASFPYSSVAILVTRSDDGELSQSAITHYRRRQFCLSSAYY